MNHATFDFASLGSSRFAQALATLYELNPSPFIKKEELSEAVMSNDRIKELESEIADLKQRLPPHSVPPAMLWKLEELEEELEKAKKER